MIIIFIKLVSSGWMEGRRCDLIALISQVEYKPKYTSKYTSKFGCIVGIGL